MTIYKNDTLRKECQLKSSYGHAEENLENTSVIFT